MHADAAVGILAATEYPRIIQGGMGVGVSSWTLARAVSALGQLGVVSGTAPAVVMARRLQLGDAGGHIRRALASFPDQAVSQRILDRYFVAGGKPESKPFKSLPMPGVSFNTALTELTVAANFVEVFLAKEGHAGVVGINYLEKIQYPTLPSLFGAMLAGVDYVLMGAGVPRFIPGILDQLSRGEPVRLRLDMAGLPADEHVFAEFDPRPWLVNAQPPKRPRFLAIISSATLAITLARKSSGKVDGFIVEGATAGGHNAPPRGPTRLNERGEPIYGERDLPDLERIRELGLPFWMAGEYAAPERLLAAMAAGATGVQVGTAFAFCEESGLDPTLKQQIIDRARAGHVDVLTDAIASPTGFPFKVIQHTGTLSDAGIYEARQRCCDLGYLRTPYRKADGSTGYRCPAEPVEDYVKKGGTEADAAGRKCICNALLADIGLGQILADGQPELPLMTAGDDVRHLARFLDPSRQTYTAADVLQYLLSGLPATAPTAAR
jgi:nitronate monooxygenase